MPSSSKYEKRPELDQDTYQLILDLLQMKKPIPVVERQPHHRRAYNVISKYGLKTAMLFVSFLDRHELRIITQGRILLANEEVDKLIEHFYYTYKGEGARKLCLRIRKDYFGIGEYSIQKWITQSKRYNAHLPSFPNKCVASKVATTYILQCHQIDLVSVACKGVADYVPNSRCYVLAILDCFSRYLWLRPVYDKHSKTVSAVVFGVYEQWGYPKAVQVRHGSEFKGEFQTLCEHYGIQIIKSSPQHPEGQERMRLGRLKWKNKKLSDLLQSGNNTFEELNTKLREYEYQYNTTKHEKIQMTPHDCHFCVAMQTETQSTSHSGVEKEMLLDTGTFQPYQYLVGDEVIIKKENVYKGVHNSFSLLSRTGLKATVLQQEDQCCLVRFSDNTEKWVSMDLVTPARSMEAEKTNSQVTPSPCSFWLTRLMDRQKRVTADYPALAQVAQLHSLQIIDTPADGNCMFHALAQQLHLFGVKLSAGQVRYTIVAFLKENKHLESDNGATTVDLTSFVEGLWETYLANMAQEGTWGDHVILLAAAHVFGCSVTVLSDVSSEPITMQPAHLQYQEQPNLLLGHVSELHYVGLIPVNTQDHRTNQVLCDVCGRFVDACHICLPLLDVHGDGLCEVCGLPRSGVIPCSCNYVLKTIQDLPDDVLILIFSLASLNSQETLNSVSVVCKRWNSLVHTERFKALCFTPSTEKVHNFVHPSDDFLEQLQQGSIANNASVCSNCHKMLPGRPSFQQHSHRQVYILIDGNEFCSLYCANVFMYNI